MFTEEPDRFNHELDRLLAGLPAGSAGLSDEDANLLDWAASLAPNHVPQADVAQAALRRRLEDRIASRTFPARLLWASLVGLMVVAGMLVTAALAAFSVHGAPAVAADNAAPPAVWLTLDARLGEHALRAPAATPAEIPRPMPTPVAPPLALSTLGMDAVSYPDHTPLAETQPAVP